MMAGVFSAVVAGVHGSAKPSQVRLRPQEVSHCPHTPLVAERLLHAPHSIAPLIRTACDKGFFLFSSKFSVVFP